MSCSVPDCAGLVVARGWCQHHYYKWYRYGDPLATVTKKPVEQRFWNKVNKNGPLAPGMDTPCWLWSRTSTDGYGYFSIGGKHIRAHRFSYSLAKGPIPPGHSIDHRCHTTLCVNPDHLRPVTPKESSENRGSNRRNRTGFRGVTMHQGKYKGQVGHHGKVIYVGMFDTADEAAEAVRAKRLELHTHNDLDRL